VLTAKEIRSSFIEFFRSKQHDFVPSSPIVPQNDPTLLFANAGMNQFKDIFIGQRKPKINRAVNSQKCLRVSGKHNDLEEVGKDTYHHTFFEMLGNWSFDDYFKAEAIEWAWQLITDVWKIDPDRIWASIFIGDEDDGLPRDSEAEKLWQKLTPLPKERIVAFGKKDNFWEMGETGPCGPCSEIHIDLGSDRCDKQDDPNHSCEVNAGCSRFIEIWNLVFIQYNRGSDGKLTTLDAHYIDTGAGLERVTAVLQDKKSNYDTDLFMPIIDALVEMTGHKYTGALKNKTDNAFRVIADHIRALTLAITDGAIPSNEGRGYVIRRILRRASRFGRELDVHEPFLYRLVPVVVDFMGDAFPELPPRADYVAQVIQAEEKSFGRTLDRGIEIFNAAAEKAQTADRKTISGEEAFQLYDTYGFPFDLTQLMAEERNLCVDTETFDKLMQQQRQRARAAQKSAGQSTDISADQLPPTNDEHKYLTKQLDAEILGFIKDNKYNDSGDIQADEQAGLVLDCTCFYAESGGQVGDIGKITDGKNSFIVTSSRKIGDTVIHQGTVEKGRLSVGAKVTAAVSDLRNETRKNHTATHLLQWAIQRVCGQSAVQQGSLVTPEYLRFDFNYPRALTDEQIQQIESLVCEKIDQALPVTSAAMSKEQAEKLGAMALFGEKYGDQVRVIAVGAESDDQLDKAISAELCGGTHVDNLAVIGGLKIIKEESVSTGIRRITALTGKALSQYLRQRSDTVDNLTKLVKAPAEELPARVEQLLAENKKLAKQIKSGAVKAGSDTMAEARTMLEKAEKINGSAVIVGKLSPTAVPQARAAIDMLKKKAPSSAIVLGFGQDDKAMLLAGVTDDLVKKGLKAGDIVRDIAPIVDGGGGGKPQMAQAGGKTPKKIDQALTKATEIIKAILTK